jgi:CheY-like chemotaxis protein/anti-sigma regulatory factor (Ser/Thr protein kinase)
MPRILLVEDNALNRDMLSRRLVRRGYDVVMAVDGEEGVRRARADAPDLILMDMSLPVLDGWEAARQIKGAPETRHVPIVALTAHAMAGDREQALAAGCDDFDTKPVELESLLAKIELLLAAGATAVPPPPVPARRLTIEQVALAHLPSLRAFVAEACPGAELRAVREALQLAVDEACTNVIVHGYAGREAGPLTLEVQREPEAVRATLTDRGAPFDPARAPAPDLESGWATRPVGGLGWHLVRQSVDELHYTSSEGINRLVLVKRLAPGQTAP